MKDGKERPIGSNISNSSHDKYKGEIRTLRAPKPPPPHLKLKINKK